MDALTTDPREMAAAAARLRASTLQASEGAEQTLQHAGNGPQHAGAVGTDRLAGVASVLRYNSEQPAEADNSHMLPAHGLSQDDAGVEEIQQLDLEDAMQQDDAGHPGTSLESDHKVRSDQESSSANQVDLTSHDVAATLGAVATADPEPSAQGSASAGDAHAGPHASVELLVGMGFADADAKKALTKFHGMCGLRFNVLWLSC
jgi:hypothetical protein